MTAERRQPHDRRTDERRTAPVWFKQDAAGVATGASRRLGRLHGPGGPLTLVHLKGCAKLQEGFHQRKGELIIAWDELAEAAFIDEPAARAIVASLVEMEEAEVVADKGWKVKLFLTGYADEQDTPSQNYEAARKRRQRERRAAGQAGADDDADLGVPAPSLDPETRNGDVPHRRDMSREVPVEVEVEVDGEGEVDAAEAARPSAPGPAPSTAYTRLGDVVAVLEACAEPNGRKLVVEPRSILSHLQAHLDGLPPQERQRLAMQAAHETAAMVQAGSNQTSNATNLFGGVLRKACEQHRREQRPPGSPRRPGAAPPSPASSTVARGDEVLASIVRGGAR